MDRAVVGSDLGGRMQWRPDYLNHGATPKKSAARVPDV